MTRPDSDIAWRPSPDAFDRSPVGRMAARLGVGSFEELALRSVTEPEWFWAAAADDVGLRWMRPYSAVLDLSDGPQFPHFFVDGQLNWADYTVDRWVADGYGGSDAIVWVGDGGESRTLTYLELKHEIDRCAGGLRELGVGRGDVVALYLPMVPEAMITLLATAKIGAVVAPMFSGFGPKPVTDRLLDSAAKVLVTCDAFPRRGRLVPLKQTADIAAQGVTSLEHLVVVRRTGEPVDMQPERDLWWDDVVDTTSPVTEAEPMGSEDACMLLYTSGSTGRPKGCVHTHAGMPFKFAQESRHGLGVDIGDRVLWVTDMGWVMGAWLTTAALTNGATAVMFEGVPDFPDPGRLWRVVDEAGVTVLGIAPTVVRALMAHGDEWPQSADLSSLRAIGSTGEPWNIGPWWWCHDRVGGGRLPMVNMSGGTECGASIVSNTIVQPIKPMAFAGPTLGMAADVFDSSGASLRGEVGELVVTQPWPGMTKGLWDGTERYLDTYWSRFDGAWIQGDFAHVDGDGHWYLHGRSDDTIMLAGKRVGPAEIESVLVSDEAVIEAAAVGVPDDVKGEALVCFVVLKDGVSIDDISERLAASIVAAEGKTVKPRQVYAVPALPKTRNGKVMRRIARSAYLDSDVGDVTALENPETLSAFRSLASSEAPGAG